MGSEGDLSGHMPPSSSSSTTSQDDSTLDLRVASIFLVALASALGCISSRALSQGGQPNSLAARLLKSFSAGVILAVAFVHVLADAQDSLQGCIDFPLAEVLALMGMLMVLILGVAMDAVLAGVDKHQTSSAHDHHDNGHTQEEETLVTSPKKAAGGCCGTNGGGCDYGSVSRAEEGRDTGHIDKARGTPAHWEQPISGGCDCTHHQQKLVSMMSDRHPFLVPYLMEGAIVFHSVIIGVGLGLATTGRATVRDLLLALMVHQFFEGAALASCVYESGLDPWKSFTMLYVVFSWTTSLGIAIGVAASTTYRSDSPTSAIVQGVANALSAGVLIYLGLVDMLSQDLHRPEVRKDRVLQVQMLLCVVAGAAVMSALAVWA